jgi:hypothetical protein
MARGYRKAGVLVLDSKRSGNISTDTVLDTSRYNVLYRAYIYGV